MIGALQALAEAYERLAALGGAKREALVALDLKRLEKILDAERAVVEEIQRLEAGRQDVLKRLSQAEPGLHSHMTMAELLAASPGKFRANLKNVHRLLSQRVERAASVGADNEFLIQGALSAVSYHLNRLNAAEVEQGYGQRGEEIVTRPRKFDFQA